jgi:hypothetical protein
MYIIYSHATQPTQPTHATHATQPTHATHATGSTYSTSSTYYYYTHIFYVFIIYMLYMYNIHIYMIYIHIYGKKKVDTFFAEQESELYSEFRALCSRYKKKKVLSIVTFYKCTQALTFSPFFFCDSVAETIIGKKF